MKEYCYILGAVGKTPSAKALWYEQRFHVQTMNNKKTRPIFFQQYPAVIYLVRPTRTSAVTCKRGSVVPAAVERTNSSSWTSRQNASLSCPGIGWTKNNRLEKSIKNQCSCARMFGWKVFIWKFGEYFFFKIFFLKIRFYCVSGDWVNKK